MATLYGNQIGGGSGANGWVIFSELWYEGDPASGTVRVHAQVGVWTKWSFTDSSNTMNVWGTMGSAATAINLATAVNSGSSTSYPYWPAANRVIVWSGYWDVATVYGATGYFGFGCSLTGLYVAGTSTASPNEISIPARPYTAPAAPTIGTATRNSDTSATVAWANNATAGAPYTNLYVDRRTDGGGFVQVASLAGSATSYTDTTVTANHFYDYRVRVSNSAGSATSGTSAAIYNTPAAPSDCAAVKTGATQVTVTCADNSNTETAFAWERTVDSGANWTALGTTGAGVTTYVDTAAPGGTVAYRVRATRSTLVSAYSATSNSVTTTTPPAAPTVTAFPVYSPTGTVLRVAWAHNSLDGSAQSKADISYNFGAAETVYALTGATGYYDIPITGKLATVVVTAKVRTYGLHASPGVYSGTTSTTLADTPAANITTPATDAAVVADVPLVVAWGYTDEFAQAGWELQLYKSGVLIGTWTGTTATSQSLGAEHLADDSSFSLSLTVRSGSGFQATATRVFRTDYLAPTVPSVSAVFDVATLASSISAYAGATGALPATHHLALQRIDAYDGVSYTEVLADSLTPLSTIIDRTPRLGQDVIYRVLAVAANGAYSTADVIVNTKAGGYYALNFGDGDAELIALAANPVRTANASDDSQALLFAGRPKPVVYGGEHTALAITFSADTQDAIVLAGVTALEQWRRAVIWRAADGQRERVKVNSVARSDDHTDITKLAFSMTAVE